MPYDNYRHSLIQVHRASNPIISKESDRRSILYEKFNSRSKESFRDIDSSLNSLTVHKDSMLNFFMDYKSQRININESDEADKNTKRTGTKERNTGGELSSDLDIGEPIEEEGFIRTLKNPIKMMTNQTLTSQMSLNS